MTSHFNVSTLNGDAILNLEVNSVINKSKVVKLHISLQVHAHYKGFH